MRYALLGILGGFFLAFAAPAAAPASYPQLSLATSTDLSYNWAGYVAQGQTYTGVSGRWLVPAVSATSTPALGVAADAAWVGLGGVSADDLLQAGTQAVVDGAGNITYEAWLELMPNPSVPLPVAIAPGDEVAVSITQTGPRLFTIEFDDNTTGQQYQTQVAYNSSLSSAEWVEEMPASLGGSFIPLDSFGQARFLSATTTVNGVSEGIAQAGGYALTMINRAGEELAAPSVLSASGGFTVTRSDAQPILRGSLPRYGLRREIYR